jgi:Family of unknown function (DUF6101)
MSLRQSTMTGRAEARRVFKKTEKNIRELHDVTSACLHAEDGPKRVEISAEWVCIRRRIAGLETWVNVPTQSYLGVNLRATAQGSLFEIVLLHLDASLEIVLTRTADDTDVIALWRDYARTLALPLLVEDSQGRLQPMEDHGHRSPFPRRYGSPLKNRRPRFLARRNTSSRQVIILASQRANLPTD